MLKKSQVLKEGRKLGIKEAIKEINKLIRENAGEGDCSSPKALAEELMGEIESKRVRSAWDRGVKEYALELLESLADATQPICNKNDLESVLLNGASSWTEYSYGGCSLIYDCDIAERVCSPSELKHCNGGEWQPNRQETWLDVQARALRQAARQIKLAYGRLHA